MTVRLSHHAPPAAGAVIGGDTFRWSFGEVVLDERALQLTVRGAPVMMEPKPLELLMFLLRRAGEVVTRQEILEALWPGRVVTDGVITNCVAKLRQALGDQATEHVLTVPRYGYRFMGQLHVEGVVREPVKADTLELTPGDPLPHRPGSRLIRPLADGGQGAIWLCEAVDNDAQRVVKFARTAEELTFLKREITLGRVLSETYPASPHFLPILGANLEAPPFFIELEYVPTGNLEEWCAAGGGLAALPLALRLDLVAQCAGALSEAHSAGVLHKDIKPGNILVRVDAGGRPVVVLSDFGAGDIFESGLLERMSITRMGFTQTLQEVSSAGTPLYLAPERIAGQPPTVQSDVYALGILLYQMVVGDFRAVLAAGWEAQVADTLLQEDIAAAAHGDPSNRLGDAGQLAERLRSIPARRVAARHLGALEAQAVASREALQRAQARRGLLLGLTTSLAVGVTLTGWLYLDARQARDLAREEADTTQAVVEFLADDLLAFANPRGASGGGDPRIRDLLEAAESRLDERFTGQPVVRARLQRTVGAAYGALGLLAPAERNLRPAIASLAASLGAGHRETQAARLALRDAYRIEHRFSELGVIGKDVRLAEEAAGREGSAQWFEGAWSEIYSNCEVEYGSLWFADCGAALHPLLTRAQAELGVDHPVTVRLLWIRGTLSLLFRPMASPEPYLAEAHARMQAQLGAHHTRVLEALMFWAWAVMDQGDAVRAERMLREAEASLIRNVGEAHEFVYMARVFLARAVLAQGRSEEAADLAQAAWVWRQQKIGLANMTSANALALLCQALVMSGRADEALAAAIAGQAALAAIGEGDSMVGLRYDFVLARAWAATGDWVRQGEVLEALEARARKLLTRGQWYLGTIVAHRGRWQMAHGDAVAGQRRLVEAVAILEKSRGRDDPQTLEVIGWLP